MFQDVLKTKTAGQRPALQNVGRSGEKLKMAMASRGPVFPLRLASLKWSTRTTRVDQPARAPLTARALVLCTLHKIRTTGGGVQ